VLVLEARPTMGGRASAFIDPATGERVDNGQHVLVGGYHETFAFLRRVNTAADVYVQPDLHIDVIDRDGRTSSLKCPALPPPLHLLAGVYPLEGDRLARSRVARPHAPDRRWSSGANCSAVARAAPPDSSPHRAPVGTAGGCRAESIDRRGVRGSVRGCASSHVHEQSARDCALGLPLKALDELYAIPSRAYIERAGGNVRVNAPARVACDDGVSVRVREETLHARAVICATAWYALPSVFPDRPAALEHVLRAAESTAASPIVTVNLWFDRPVTSHSFVGLPGRAMQWVFDKRAILGDGSSHLSLVSSGASALVGQGNQELIDLAVGELTAAVPAVRAAVLRRAVVVREKRATFSVAPGQPQRPGVETAIPGVFLAGDWIDTGLPATIESAVVSGHRSADAVLRFLAGSR
jgi:zeta-carotene desaturase